MINRIVGNLGWLDESRESVGATGREVAQTTFQRVEVWVRQQPIASLALAASVGLLVGYLVKRRM